MRKMWKKGLAFFLAVIMTVGMLPTTALAAVDSTGRPTDLKNTLVLSIYTGDGFPGEPAVYGTSNYKNFNSSFKVQSGATFKSSAESELDTKILQHMVQGTPSGNTTVWGAYDANGMKNYFREGASIIQPENEAKMIRAIKTELKNASDEDVLSQYEIVWYVIKLQHSPRNGWWGRATTEWHIDGVIKEKEKISINYYGNGNTDGSAPKGETDHTAGEAYTVLGKNDMVKKINGVEVAFLGWSAKADGTGAEAGFYQPGDVIKPTESISLYAMWDTTTQYTATVKTHLDGVLTGDDDIHGVDRELYLSTDATHFYPLTESDTGVYTTKITGNGKFHLYHKNDNGTYDQIGTYQLTIYNQNANLDVHHYSVTYDPNGGAFKTEPGKEVYFYGDSVAAITEVPVKEGYRFLGWKDGDGSLIKPGEEVTSSITETIILTAQWEKTVNVTVNVTINHVGGDGYDKMDTKDDVLLSLVSRADKDSAYLETGDNLILNKDSHTGFEYSYSENVTKYIATGSVFTDMPGGTAEYTVVTSKSGYDTSVEAKQDANGDWVIDVVMTYNPTNFDLGFIVKVDESVPDQYLPNAAIVKVTFWSTDRKQWEIITQQEGGAPGVRVDIDPQTRQGFGSYPVWKYESNGSTPYGYRIQVTAFVYPDGTIVPTSDATTYVAWTDQVYTATAGDVSDGGKYGELYGAYFADAADAQSGTVNANITMDLHDVKFDAQGGEVNGQDTQTVKDQYKVPGFKGYIPTRDGGYIFDGWYEDKAYTIPATEGKDLKDDITLYAKWIEPLTISGTVSISGTYIQNGEQVAVHDIDRADAVVVVLQELRNGAAYDVDSITVNFEDYDSLGASEYSFTGIPNDGKNYRIRVLILNYGTTYDNEQDDDTSYSANEFNAVFAGDNVADVDAYLKFVPPSYDQILNVDATQIGDKYRPTTVLSEVLYRDTGDNYPFQRISQHDVAPFGVIIGLTGGIGDGTQSIWKWHTDGTLYDYQMNITMVDDKVFNSDTAPFYIIYGEPAYWNGTTDAPSAELQATLIPKQYKVVFDLNAGEDTVSGMDALLQEDGSYAMTHTWSFDTAISAVPNRYGYRFLGWAADVNGAYDGDKIDSAVHQDVVLTAQWEVISKNTITTVADPEAGGVTTGDGVYDFGSSVTVTATANKYYQFAGWYENGEKISDNAEYTFIIASDRVLTAKFVTNAHTIQTVADPDVAGTVSGGGFYETGTQITLNANANTGYRFIGWYENGEKVSDSAEYMFTVTCDRVLTAKFVEKTYIIQAVANPNAGGAVSGGGTYREGTEITLSAIANTGYRFDGWYENGEKVSDNGKYTFIVTADRELTAKFVEKTYTIYTVTTPTEGGTVSGGGTYQEGKEITLRAEVNAGYNFTGWFAENGELITIEPEFSHVVTGERQFEARYHMTSVYENDYAYIFGYSDTEMGAEGPLLRCEAAVMVHRLVKQNGERGDFVYDPAKPSFTDIAGEWFQSGIEYIHYKGGFDVPEGSNVNPYEQITRGEVFKIIVLGLGFSDDTNLTYDEYGKVLVNRGYVIGDLDSGSSMTRAEFCVMYNVIIGRSNALLKDAEGNQITAETYGFTDLDPDAWYYEDILRATSAYDENGFVDLKKRAKRNDVDDYTN